MQMVVGGGAFFQECWISDIEGGLSVLRTQHRSEVYRFTDLSGSGSLEKKPPMCGMVTLNSSNSVYSAIEGV